LTGISYVAYNAFIEFWPSRPTLSIFYLGQVFHFGTFNFYISFLTSSTRHVFGLPIGLLEMGFQEYIAFTIPVPSGLLFAAWLLDQQFCSLYLHCSANCLFN
jgi:hypothetical protein